MKLLVFFFMVAIIANGKEIKKPTPTGYHQWEVRTAPVALFASWYTLDVSYRLNENFALGPAAIIYNSNATQGSMFMPTYKGTAIGGQAYYYFNSFSVSTWYFGTHLFKESYRSYPHAFRGYDELDGFKGNATLGYQIKTGTINWMLGIGGEQRDHDVISYEENKLPVESRESFFGLLLEFKVGLEI